MVLKAAIRFQDYVFLNEAARNEGTLSVDFFNWARHQMTAGKVSFDSIEDGYCLTLLTHLVFMRIMTVFSVPPLPRFGSDMRQSRALFLQLN